MSNKSTEQLDRFKEAVRALQTDDDEVKLNERLRKLAKQKPDDNQADG